MTTTVERPGTVAVNGAASGGPGAGVALPVPPKARRRWGLFAAMAAVVCLGALGNVWLHQATTNSTQVVAALKYMQTKGGTIIQHGRTHQYGKLNNPYNGVSGDDFEFYRAHVDANDSVIYDGPISVNSYLRAVSLITLGRLDFALVGISAPKIWEFPHYAGGAQDYKAVQDLFGKGYDRRLYFPGYLQKKTIDYSKHIGQFFPYDVVDVYGTKVIPENAGNYEPEAFNNHPAVLVPDLVERARLNLTVRDGFASYFYHPYYGLEPLQQLVEGVNSLGAYTWVAPGSV